MEQSLSSEGAFKNFDYLPTQLHEVRVLLEKLKIR
jgi:hypothetical protein